MAFISSVRCFVFGGGEHHRPPKNAPSTKHQAPSHQQVTKHQQAPSQQGAPAQVMAVVVVAVVMADGGR
jgi:hypothetical protein